MSYVRGRADYLELGTWNTRCSMCGRKFKAYALTKNWQGMWRCDMCQEPRQPQDFVRGIPDVQTPPWVQNMEVEFTTSVCFPNDTCAIPGFATPGCVMPSYINPINTIPFYNPGQIS